MEVIKTWSTDQIRPYEIKNMGQHLQNIACLQITYVYTRNQGLDSMSRYETLAMDEMQKDFLGLNIGRHAKV